MIKKTVLISFIILILSGIGSSLLSLGVNREDRYELVEVERIKTEYNSLSVDFKDMHVFSEDVETINNEIIIYQPRFWYELTTIDNQHKTEISYISDVLSLKNDQGISVVTFHIRDTFISGAFKERDERYYSSKSYFTPTRWVSNNIQYMVEY